MLDRVSTDVETDDEGGDPACWLSRVCPDCGLLADDEPPTRCERCAAELTGE